MVDLQASMEYRRRQLIH